MKHGLLILFFILNFIPGLMASPSAITFATDATYPPFEFVDKKGQLTGFEVEIINDACIKMNANCQILNFSGDFNNLLTNLKAGKYNAAFGAFGITHERLKLFNFSNPYYQPSSSLIGPTVKNFTLEDHVMTTDYQNKKVLFAWTGSPLLNLIVGVKTDESEIFENIQSLRNYTILSAALIMLLVIIAAFYLATSITRPIQKLTASVQEDTQGKKLLMAVDPELLASSNEIGVLANAFKAKSEEIESYLSQLHNAQEQMIQSEKMAALGNLVAGVAHEINTPLGAINATISNMSHAVTEILNQMPELMKNLPEIYFKDFFNLLDRSLNKKQTEFTFFQKREKKKEMIKYLEERNIQPANYIADMLNDMGIYDQIDDYVPFMQSEKFFNFLKVAYDFALLQTSKNNISAAIKLISKVVFALKYYSHTEFETKKTKDSLQHSIEVILTLYHNQIKHGIEVVRHYEDMPEIEAYFDELTQVWTNIIYNAIQAMHNKGILTIDLYQKNNDIYISFTDNGPGIPSEIMPKIFEPFFTTKSAGEGSGLGLSIVKRIVDKHHGRIEVTSAPGKTTFTIILPKVN